jgi:murein L,D-transpeptidase YafK
MADRILIEKGARRLQLLNRGKIIAEYPVKLGLSPKGHKQYEGDFRTPEGVYHLSRRNPGSEFFLSVEVSYPNEADRARAKAEGLRPGGLIMIHGQPNVPRKPAEYYASRDWTDGCIAVTNAAMIDIWQRTRVGIPIEIRP